MKDQEKTKAQLLNEMGELRRRIAELEAMAAESGDGEDGKRGASTTPDQSGHEDSGEFDSLGTQSIELTSAFTEDLTVSGSFSFTGVAQTWFGKLLEALPIPAFLLDQKGNIVFANQACGRISRHYEEVKGKPFSSLFVNPWVADAARSLVKKVFSMRLRGSMQGVLEIGQGRVWGRLYLRSMRLGDSRSVLGLIEDLTLEKEQLVLKQRHEEEILKERNELETRVTQRTAELVKINDQLREEIASRQSAEDALYQGEAKYRVLVENSPLGIVSCDMRGDITELNPALLHILGAPAADAVSSNILSSSSWCNSDASHVIRECLESGKRRVREFFCKTKWGKEAFIKLHVAPIRDAEARIIGAQAVVEDITERKRNETLLLRAERLRALVEMAGNVEHYFNASLQAMAGDTQMALACVESGNFFEVRPLLRKMLDSANQTAQTLRRLKQFAHSRSAVGDSQRKAFDLSEAVKHGIEQTKLWCNANLLKGDADITFVADLAEGCTVAGDNQEMVEVVVSLLKNAAEAVPTGGQVKVRAFADRGQVVLQVKDKGEGIPKKNLVKISEPFWTSKPTHVGLGLAVSSGIIRRHGGTLAIASRERAGTKVTVTLPHVEIPSRGEQSAVEESPAPKFRILLIEKDKGALKALESGLALLGQTTFVAMTGRQGLDTFCSQQFDAVVCGFAIHDMNGWEISEAIEEAADEKAIPRPIFVLLTGATDDVLEQDIASHPAVDRIIGKHTDPRTLLDIIGGEVTELSSQTTTFSGSIHGIDILEYLQLILLSGQRVVVEILSRDHLRGLVFVDKGAFVHAMCGGTEGEEGLFKCLTFGGGTFSSLPWRKPPRTSISKPGDLLLFEAARRRDEMNDQ